MATAQFRAISPKRQVSTGTHPLGEELFPSARLGDAGRGAASMGAAACPWRRQGPSEAKQCHTVATHGLLRSFPEKELQTTPPCSEEEGKRLQLQGARSPELPEDLLSLSSPQLHSTGALAVKQI